MGPIFANQNGRPWQDVTAEVKQVMWPKTQVITAERRFQRAQRRELAWGH